MAFPNDSAQTIYSAAHSIIIDALHCESQWTIPTIDSLLLLEVRCIQKLCLTLRERFAGEGPTPGRLPGSAEGRTKVLPAKKERFYHLQC